MSAAPSKVIPTRSEVRARGKIEHAPSLLITLRGAAGDVTTGVWICIATPGRFKGHASGTFEMNEQTFKEIIRNFKNDPRSMAPADYEHSSEQPSASGSIPTTGAPACGWVTDVELRADGNLWACVRWDEQAAKYIKAGAYRFISPAIIFGSKDQRSGENVGARLSSIALTNSPFLSWLPPVTAKATAGENSDDELSAYAALDESGFPRWCSALTFANDELALALKRADDAEGRIASLEAEVASFKDRELGARVDEAFAMWGRARALTADHRPVLLAQAKADPLGFEVLFPRPIPGAPPPPSLNLVAAGQHTIAPHNKMAEERPVQLAQEPPVPKTVDLAAKFEKEAAAKGEPISREEAFAMGHKKRTELLGKWQRGEPLTNNVSQEGK